jgi:hypothetical protein
MRLLGLVGLVLGLALVAYLVLGYLNEGTRMQRTLQEEAAPAGETPAAARTDLSRRGLEQRLAPTLDRAKERAEQTDRAAEP